VFKNKYIFSLLFLVLILPAFYFFLKPGIYWNMHDDMQIIRQLDFEKCLTDGQIPCRWVPDLGYEYGYPLFNFYPPLTYIVGEIFRILHFSFLDTIKLVAATQIILTAIFMYLLGKSLTNKMGGLLSAIFYTYAPYHAVNIYIRGAMNEAWASTFFPLVLYFIRQLILDPKPIYILSLAVSYSAILLSHNPMAMIFAPVCIVWALYWIYDSKNTKNYIIYKYLLISAILSLSLSAFLTLPLLFETKFVQVESMFAGYYHYSVHFATFYQMFLSTFWGDGPSVWGTDDKMSFMIGYLHWIIPLILMLIFIYNYIKTKQTKNLIAPILVLLGLGYAFMAHERSTPIWLLINPIQKVQFPWRFLNLVIFLMSLSVAYFSKIVKNKYLIFTLIIGVIALNYSYFYPIHSGPISDSQKLSGESWRLLTTASIYDYLPKTASTAAKKPALPFIDDINPAATKYQITGQKKGTDWQFFNINLDTNSTVTLSVLYFPDFIVTDFGKVIKTKTEPLLGRITIDLTAGNHQIYVKLHNTPIRTISNILSFIAWSFTIYFFVKFAWNKSKSKK